MSDDVLAVEFAANRAVDSESVDSAGKSGVAQLVCAAQFDTLVVMVHLAVDYNTIMFTHTRLIR